MITDTTEQAGRCVFDKCHPDCVLEKCLANADPNKCLACSDPNKKFVVGDATSGAGRCVFDKCHPDCAPEKCLVNNDCSQCLACSDPHKVFVVSYKTPDAGQCITKCHASCKTCTDHLETSCTSCDFDTLQMILGFDHTCTKTLIDPSSRLFWDVSFKRSS
jgi:hypothetical protein